MLALDHGFNRVGLDHVLLVRIASTAVATAMLGGRREEVVNALSNAFIDGGACAPIAMHRTPVRESRGPPATPPAGRCAWPCWPGRARWATPRP